MGNLLKKINVLLTGCFLFFVFGGITAVNAEELPPREKAPGSETAINIDVGNYNSAIQLGEKAVISGNRIVWADRRNGNSDIYMYDLITHKETPICTAAENQIRPSIYADKIVWEDARNNGNSDIYMYDLSTGKESSICSASGHQHKPVIYKDKVVWADNRSGNWDIYMYDLSTQTERPICTDPAYQDNPSIYKDKIVWEDTRNSVTYSDIYLYDLTTNTESLICNDNDHQTHPIIYKNKVIWSDVRVGNKIVIYDLDNPAKGEQTVSLITTSQEYPAIYEDKVVWQDNYNNEGYNIAMYDLSKDKLFMICEEGRNQFGPTIYEDKIAWLDYRNSGNLGVYLYTLAEQTFPVNITAISPSRNFKGQGDFILTLYGTGFSQNSQVAWNGEVRPTTFVSSNQLSAQIPAQDLVIAGTAAVSVVDSSVGEEPNSNAKNFSIVDYVFSSEGSSADSYTKLLLHGEGDEGSTNFVDSSDTQKAIAVGGNARINTGISKFGNASIFLDGDSDYVSLSDSADFDFGSGDFTIDFWVKFNNYTGQQTFLEYIEDLPNGLWYFEKTDTNALRFGVYWSKGGGSQGQFSSEMLPWNNNQWYHVAVVRSGNSCLMFRDGVSLSVSENTAWGTWPTPNATMYIGQNGSGDMYINGWIDELRISKGIARNFDSGISGVPQVATLLPAQVYVSDSFTQDNCAGHTWQYDAFDNIQDAVNNVSSGGTVQVASSTYDLRSPVLINRPITLIGDIQNPKNVVVNAPTIRQNRDCFEIASSNVTIKGFKIQNAPDFNNRADGNAGIDIGRTPNKIAGLENIEISNNEFNNNAYGIFVYRAKNITIFNNKIHDSYSLNIEGHLSGKGIMLYGEQDVYGGLTTGQQNSGITIKDNQIYDNMYSGIDMDQDNLGYNLWQDLNIVIDGNKIYNNGFDDTKYNYPVYDNVKGISIGPYVQKVTITNNEIYGHKLYKDENIKTETMSAGISAKNARNISIINGNNIHGNLRGILITGQLSQGSVIDNNTITDNAFGVYISDSAKISSLSKNNISGNTPEFYTDKKVDTYGLVNLGAETINAADNWWGSEDGPNGEAAGSGDKIKGAIDYAPWYLDGNKGSSSQSILAPEHTISINNGQEWTNVRDVVLSLGSTKNSIGDAAEVMLSENPDFSGAKWERFVYTKTFTLSDGDGLKTIYSKIRDRAGNESSAAQIKSDSIRLDRIAPAVVLRGGVPGNLTNSTGATITVEGQPEAITHYKYQLLFNGNIKTDYSVNETAAGEPIKLQGLPDGIYTLNVIGRDESYNWPDLLKEKEKIATATWEVDATPPKAVFVSGVPDTIIRVTSAVLEIGGEGVVSYKYKLDGAEFSAERKMEEGNKIGLSFGEGSHTLYLIGCDKAGNWQKGEKEGELDGATKIYWTVKLSNDPPQIVSFYPEKDSVSIQEGQTQRFAVSAKDPENDEITYTWFMGKKEMQKGEIFDYRPDYETVEKELGYKEETVKVIISDGKKLIEKQWYLSIKDVNTKPKIISVLPPAKDQIMTEGSSLPLILIAADDEDKILTCIWKVDGKEISRKTISNAKAAAATVFSYVYSPDFESPGIHNIEAEVSDSRASAVNTWSIQVERASVVPLKSWDFNKDTDAQGWKNEGDLVGSPTVSGGTYKANFIGYDPRMNAPDKTSFDASKYQNIRIRYRATNGDFGQLFWQTEPPLLDNQGKAKVGYKEFPVIADGKFHVANIDLSKEADWKGMIAWLRVDPVAFYKNVAVNGEIEIDYIRIYEGPAVTAPAWEFNTSGDAEGWKANNSIDSPSVGAGYLSGKTAGANAEISVKDLKINADINKGLLIRCRLTPDKSITDGTTTKIAKVLWQKAIDGRQVSTSFNVEADEIFHTYAVDFSQEPEWRDELTTLAINPIVCEEPVRVEIDYIRVVDNVKAAPVWEFNEAGNNENWTTNASLSDVAVTVDGTGEGFLEATVTGPSPIISIGSAQPNPILSIDASSYKGVSLRMKTDNGKKARLVWGIDGKYYAFVFNTANDNRFHTYEFDFSANPKWQGNIQFLRIDPVVEEILDTHVALDFVRIVDSIPGRRWEFNQEADPQDWYPKEHVSQLIAGNGGLLQIISSGGTAAIENDNLNFSAASYPYLQIRYSASAGEKVWVKWEAEEPASDVYGIPISGQQWTYINPDGISNHSIIVDLTKNPNWKGQIVNLTVGFDKTTPKSIVNIDYLRFFRERPQYEPMEWDFNAEHNAEGWKAVNGLTSLQVFGGDLRTYLFNSDPYIYGPLGQDIDADTLKTIEIRFKVVVSDLSAFPSFNNARMQLFWARDGERFSYNERLAPEKQRMAIVPVNILDQQYHTYEFKLAPYENWSGIVKQLRIDPILAVPELKDSPKELQNKVLIMIDYIKVKE